MQVHQARHSGNPLNLDSCCIHNYTNSKLFSKQMRNTNNAEKNEKITGKKHRK